MPQAGINHVSKILELDGKGHSIYGMFAFFYVAINKFFMALMFYRILGPQLKK